MPGVVVWLYDPARGWQRDPPAVHPAYWSANNSEAQVAMMQAQPPPPEPGVRALGEWHRLMDPPAPQRGPHD